MLKIRLQRFGRKREPTFRVVLTDSRSAPKSGKFLEVLGSHDPRERGKEPTALKHDRILHWISKGAQTSDTMHNLLIRHGIIKGEKIDVSSKKKRKAGAEQTRNKHGTNAENKTEGDTNEVKTEAPDSDGKKEEKVETEEKKKEEAEEAPQKEIAAGEVPPSPKAMAGEEEPIEAQKEVDEEDVKKESDEKTEDDDKKDTEKAKKDSDNETPKGVDKS